MTGVILIVDYLKWHYTRALFSIWRIVNNFVYFFYHLFSIPLLLHTLFDPWRLMTEEKKKGAKAVSVFERIVGNLLVRVIGVVMRFATITVGLLFCLCTLLSGALFTVFWLVIPLVVPLSIFVGIRIIA